MSDFTEMLRARAACIRATNFVHIGEQDARDFAALFDQAAKQIDELEADAETMKKHDEEMYMDGLNCGLRLAQSDTAASA